MKNYRSAIAAVHGGFADGSTVSDNRAIGQLTKGMFVTRPPVRKLVPSWDLFSVLSALTKPPFEPLSGATLLGAGRMASDRWSSSCPRGTGSVGLMGFL